MSERFEGRGIQGAGNSLLLKWRGVSWQGPKMDSASNSGPRPRASKTVGQSYNQKEMISAYSPKHQGGSFPSPACRWRYNWWTTGLLLYEIQGTRPVKKCEMVNACSFKSLSLRYLTTPQQKNQYVHMIPNLVSPSNPLFVMCPWTSFPAPSVSSIRDVSTIDAQLFTSLYLPRF